MNEFLSLHIMTYVQIKRNLRNGMIHSRHHEPAADRCGIKNFTKSHKIQAT